ncbi:hypothetical protein QBC34DRAFT_402074 [Podospora aff. communis PSN243]|uniref:Ankyrin n=1 Tax=Podospora aff. communis PSN243 TaxID=3040156 RepID=A0AAV9GUG7_9PEZI|nr:hypothetical protein QBC34DRAFT_402074 [Podospora aff. communis PSN243]
MDPLSITASIAGIGQLASTVFHGLNRFIKETKGAQARVAELARETRNLGGLLHNLTLLQESLHDSGPAVGLSLQAYHLDACRQTLLKIKGRVTDLERRFGGGGKLDRLRTSVQFSKEEMDELLADMARHKATLEVALSADTMTKLLEALSGQKEIRDGIASVMETIQKRNDAEMELRKGERKNVIEFFAGATNPRSSLGASLSLRHPMTGLWLLGDPQYMEWRTTPNSKLWLTGMPGSGKTVLCGTVIEDLSKIQDENDTIAVVYFFCDYRDAKSQDVVTILGSLAAQMALHHPQAFDLLKQAYNDHMENHGAGVAPPLGYKSLSKVIQGMAKCFTTAFIVVDALDECGRHSAQVAEILRTIAETCEEINMALFSRAEEDIDDLLSPSFARLNIAAHTADVELYVGAEMAKRRTLKDLHVANPSLNQEIRERLVNGANGMFRWVACQLDYLSSLPTHAHRRRALNKLPPTLSGTYDRILQQVSLDHQDKDVRAIVQKTLWWIGVATPRLTIPQLCEAVSVVDGERLEPEGVVDETEILRRCSSLIRRTQDKRHFEFAHFTVQEYLEAIDPNSSLACYRLSKDIALTALAATSIRVLTLPQFDRQPATDPSEQKHVEQRARQHPFYRYASQTWFTMLNPNCISEELEGLVGEFFALQRSRNFNSWIVDFLLGSVFHQRLHQEVDMFWRRSFRQDRDVWAIITAALRSDLSPLHIAAAIGQAWICKLLLEDGADANQRSFFGTPLHFSLLSSWVFHAELREHANSRTAMEISWKMVDALTTVEGTQATLGVLLAAGARAEALWKGTSPARIALERAWASGRPALFLPFLRHPSCLEDGFPEYLKEVCENSGKFAILLTSEKARVFRSTLAQGILAELRTTETAVPGSRWQPLGRLVSIANLILLEEGGETLSSLSMIDPTLSMGDEEFAQAYNATIRRDQGNTIRYFIRDPRFMPSDAVAVVHLAAEHGAEKVMSELLQAENIDIGCRDSTGRTALHFCATREGLSVLRLLLQRQAISSTEQDSDGNTVYHTVVQAGRPSTGKASSALYTTRPSAQSEIDVVETLLRFDTSRDKALATVSESGRAPFAEALNRGCSLALLTMILQHCPPGMEYLASDEPILVAAARRGSWKLVNLLLQRYRSEGIDMSLPDGSNPLHHIRLATAEPDLVKHLKSCFDVCGRRKSDGLLPIEAVLLATQKTLAIPESHDPKGPGTLVAPWPKTVKSNLAEFLTEDVVQHLEVEGRCLWDSYFSLPANEDPNISEILPLEVIVDLFLGSGVAASHERLCGETALLPLIRSFALRGSDGSVEYRWDGNRDDAVKATLTASRLFKDDANNPEVVEFAHWLLTNEATSTVALLLDGGTSVHSRSGRVDGRPLLQHAAEEPYASVELFQQILQRAANNRLDEIYPFPSELSLLHSLIASEIDAESQMREEKVKSLLSLGANPNVVDKTCRKTPAIVKAARRNQVGVVRLLLEYGARVGARDANGYDILYEAASLGSVALFKLVEAVTPQANWMRSYNVSRDVARDRKHPLIESELSLLHAAAYFGHPDAVDYLLRKGIFNSGTKNNVSPLIPAVDLIWVQDKHKATPLHICAIANSKAHAARILINEGADVNQRNADGDLPIDLALRVNNISVARLLLHFRSDLGRRSSWTPSHIRKLHYYYPRSAFHRRRGDPERTLDGKVGIDLAPSMLEAAIMSKDHRLAGELLSAFGHTLANGPVPSCQACSPLRLAVGIPNAKMLAVLLRNRARPAVAGSPCPFKREEHHGRDISLLPLVLSTKSPRRKRLENLGLMVESYRLSRHNWFFDTLNPIHAAVILKDTKFLSWIWEHMSHNAAHYKALVREWAAETEAPDCLTLVADNNSDDCYLRRALEIPTGRHLPFHPAIPNGTSRSESLGLTLAQKSPLHIAAILGRISSAKWLVRKGVNIDRPSANYGVSPLMCALEAGHIQIAELLLHEGANPNLRARGGETPLSFAVMSKSLEAVNLVIKEGADPLALTSSNENMLAWSVTHGTPAIFLSLLGLGAGLDPLHRSHQGQSAISCALQNPAFQPLLLNSPSLLLDAISHPTTLTRSLLEAATSCTASFLHRLLRRLPPQTRREALNARDPDLDQTPLCYASSMGRADSVAILLHFGADLDMDGSIHGSAVMAASAHARLETVKMLVRRHGASLCCVTTSTGVTRSAVTAAAKHPEVVRWLLVEQFIDLRRLMASSEESFRYADGAEEETILKPWAGCTVIRCATPRDLTPPRDGSYLDRLVYLRRVRMRMRGRVVVPVVESTPWGKAPLISKVETYGWEDSVWDDACSGAEDSGRGESYATEREWDSGEESEEEYHGRLSTCSGSDEGRGDSAAGVGGGGRRVILEESESESESIF